MHTIFSEVHQYFFTRSLQLIYKNIFSHIFFSFIYFTFFDADCCNFKRSNFFCSFNSAWRFFFSSYSILMTSKCFAWRSEYTSSLNPSSSILCPTFSPSSSPSSTLCHLGTNKIFFVFCFFSHWSLLSFVLSCYINLC